MTRIADTYEKILLREIIFHLTTQRLNKLFDEAYAYVTCDQPVSNFEQNHPESGWFMKEVKYAFTVFTVPLWESYAKPVPEILCNQLVNRSVELISKLLCAKLYAETAGLEYEFIVALAGEAYESKSSDGLNVAIVPECEISSFATDENFIFDVKDRLKLEFSNVHAIRKQLNLAVNGALAIAKDYKKGAFYTVGILSTSTALKYPSLSFKKGLSWEYCIPCEETTATHNEAKKKEHMGEQYDFTHEKNLPKDSVEIDSQTYGGDIALNCSSPQLKQQCVLRYYKGSFMLPRLNLFYEVKSELADRFYGQSQNDAKKYTDTIARIVLQTDLCDHGAVLIFSDSECIKCEVETLAVSTRRGMKLPTARLLLNQEETVKQLSNIDGAILVDFSGSCHACGVILDGVSSSSGNTGRGARYNSTRTYIEHRMEKYPNSTLIGVVKSEDGMLNIFPEPDDLGNIVQNPL